MRKPIIAGNWKMYKTIPEAVKLVEGLKEKLTGVSEVEIVVCPPFTALYRVSNILEGSNIKLGAQNTHWEVQGAFTGEVSPLMLKDLGCEYVIIGHSERRTYFFESNNMVNKKVKAALRWGLSPIMCVGETLEEREVGKTFQVVRDQIEGGLNDLTKDEVHNLVIAYEPVWAIGTGRTATPDQANEVHLYIRKLLTEMHGESLAKEMRIQYGGSVRPDNIKELMAMSDIDGALVGGASLDLDSFVKIVRYSEKQNNMGRR